MVTLWRILAIFALALIGKLAGGYFHAENAGLLVGIALGYALAMWTYEE